MNIEFCDNDYEFDTPDHVITSVVNLGSGYTVTATVAYYTVHTPFLGRVARIVGIDAEKSKSPGKETADTISPHLDHAYKTYHRCSEMSMLLHSCIDLEMNLPRSLSTLSFYSVKSRAKCRSYKDHVSDETESMFDLTLEFMARSASVFERYMQVKAVKFSANAFCVSSDAARVLMRLKGRDAATVKDVAWLDDLTQCVQVNLGAMEAHLCQDIYRSVEKD